MADDGGDGVERCQLFGAGSHFVLQVGIGFVELGRHQVELMRQFFDFIAGVCRDALAEVALRHFLRRLDQLDHWPGDARHPNADNDCRDDQPQNQQNQQGDLVMAAAADQSGPRLFGDHRPRNAGNGRKSGHDALSIGTAGVDGVALAAQSHLHHRLIGQIIARIAAIGMIDHYAASIYQIEAAGLDIQAGNVFIEGVDSPAVHSQEADQNATRPSLIAQSWHSHGHHRRIAGVRQYIRPKNFLVGRIGRLIGG